MATVLTYGTFDLFHVGHVRLLKRLSAMGERLIVGLSSDDFNHLKGKKTVMSFAQRKEILESCRYVDEVFEECCWEQKRGDVLKYGATIFAMGDDWAGKFDDLQDIVNVVYLARTEDISTTEVKDMIANINESKKQALVNSVNELREQINQL
ncbi:adenylyltransferase/cytidyltransferase family protein [Vibrio agarivorans]|uniref:adenylyltransferase/cytidyltransferase family protein n=1 Tax=Vibrio agarivorans TaxID=153622 RepID=UPI002230E190|nr:adenylyltransferase/cytidyltransferase family protein [Vibrio agarivorans]